MATGIKIQEDSTDGNKVKTILDGGIVKAQIYLPCLAEGAFSLTFSNIIDCAEPSLWCDDPNITFDNFVYQNREFFVGHYDTCHYIQNIGGTLLARIHYDIMTDEIFFTLTVKRTSDDCVAWSGDVFASLWINSSPVSNYYTDCVGINKGYDGEAAWSIS